MMLIRGSIKKEFPTIAHNLTHVIPITPRNMLFVAFLCKF